MKNSGTVRLIRKIMIEDVPSYGNKIFYSLGFLAMICFTILIITGVILGFFGPNWWFSTGTGVFIRSIHLWAAQAFVVFIILHLTVVFLTGGYRPPRRLLWILGSLMFFFVLIEAEFGYILRNDFSSQWRSLQGSDLYNGSGLGKFINNLNYVQVYGIHIVVIPFIVLGLLFLHYGLIRLRGIATPYKKETPYTMVKADHRLLFLRGFVLVCVIVLLAIVFPSPLIAPITIRQVATEEPGTMAKTLLAELDKISDTATYMDNIDPYRFDTRTVYVEAPYRQYNMLRGTTDALALFESEDKNVQAKNIASAGDYFDKKGQITIIPNMKNPVIPLISALVLMGQSGLYESSLKNESDTGYNPTYATRFLSDTGVLEDKATGLGITTEQYGMLREGKGSVPPGAWWLTPLGTLDNTILKSDDNQDRDGAEILGVLMLIFISFPYIPVFNRLPDALGIYKFIWKDKNADQKTGIGVPQ